jgi:hypothetical protein
MSPRIIATNRWGTPYLRRPDYLPVRRMERKRAPLATVLADLPSLIPVQDWRLLVSLSRQLVLSHGLLKGILEDKATGVVGDGFDPEFLGTDEAWGEKAKTYLTTDFYPSAELRGILDFKDLQFQKSTNMDASGDIFRVLTNHADGTPAIQLIQAHRVGQRQAGNMIEGGEYAGHRIENGIVINPKTGEVVGYLVLGETEAEDRILPKGPCAHLIDPIFADQVRGLPVAISGIRALVMNEKTTEHEEEFLENLSRIFLIEKNPTGTVSVDFDGGETEDSKVHDLMAGLCKVFEAGTNSSLEAFNLGDRPSEAYDRFSDRSFRLICAGAGWPYELSWKLGELTSVGVHSVERKARQAIRDRQSKIVPSAVEEIRWAISQAIKLKILPPSPEWRMWSVSLPPAYSLNPTKAADSRRKDLELGLTTVGRILKDEGIQGGAKTLFRERATEIAAKKQIRDEVQAASGQTISDEEMGRLGAGSQAPAPANNSPQKTQKPQDDQEDES